MRGVQHHAKCPRHARAPKQTTIYAPCIFRAATYDAPLSIARRTRTARCETQGTPGTQGGAGRENDTQKH
eukprot:11105371-Alexandrium_andersonii.AAC.1